MAFNVIMSSDTMYCTNCLVGRINSLFQVMFSRSRVLSFLERDARTSCLGQSWRSNTTLGGRGNLSDHWSKGNQVSIFVRSFCWIWRSNDLRLFVIPWPYFVDSQMLSQDRRASWFLSCSRFIADPSLTPPAQAKKAGKVSVWWETQSSCAAWQMRNLRWEFEAGQIDRRVRPGIMDERSRGEAILYPVRVFTPVTVFMFVVQFWWFHDLANLKKSKVRAHCSATQRQGNEVSDVPSRSSQRFDGQGWRRFGFTQNEEKKTMCDTITDGTILRKLSRSVKEIFDGWQQKCCPSVGETLRECPASVTPVSRCSPPRKLRLVTFAAAPAPPLCLTSVFSPGAAFSWVVGFLALCAISCANTSASIWTVS